MNEDRIRALDCWKGSISISVLAGGITNVNHLIQDGNSKFVVRCCEDRSYLGIDRRNERICQEAAFQAGVSPEVTHCADGMLVTRYIDAAPLNADGLRDEALLARLSATIRRLHDVRDDLAGEMLYFCPFQTVRTYAATARRLNARLPSDLDAYLDDAKQLARGIGPFRPTLCHNDLLPANIIDDGARLWLVDWEYAGIGNPLFDLASISSNAQLNEELESVLVKAYAGTVNQQILRDVQILKTVSFLREALWSVIQSVASDLEFDYDQYTATNLAGYREARQKLGTAR